MRPSEAQLKFWHWLSRFLDQCVHRTVIPFVIFSLQNLPDTVSVIKDRAQQSSERTTKSHVTPYDFKQVRFLNSGWTEVQLSGEK